MLALAQELLAQATQPHVREAINATGIILHTGLGRAVFPGGVVDSILGEMKGYCTLAVDRETGERAERDELVEYVLTELTGAEAATVVNNNAAATMLVLAALAAQKEVIVSRGQLIEIGGSFRLPEVMAQSGARWSRSAPPTARTSRITRGPSPKTRRPFCGCIPATIASSVSPAKLPCASWRNCAAPEGLTLIDDLGAGALVDLKQFGLPHEPTVRESIEAGADVVLFSGDKLIGAGQSGIIVGQKTADQQSAQTSADARRAGGQDLPDGAGADAATVPRPALLRREHPTYRMICTPVEALRARAQGLAAGLMPPPRRGSKLSVDESVAFLGSGSLPTEAIPSIMLSVCRPGP